MHRLVKYTAVVLLSNVVGFGGAITVNGTDDIFYAGQSSTGTGLGTLPSFIPLGTLNPQFVQFTSITGSANFCGGSSSCNVASADGIANPYGGTGTNFSAPGTGVSGIQYTGQAFFLVGAFTNGSAPSGAAPGTLSYDSSSALLGNYAPVLNQLFFVGDGQWTGGQQFFVVPSGATSLYLGFADGTPGFSGTVGAYADNSGSFIANFQLGFDCQQYHGNCSGNTGSAPLPNPGTGGSGGGTGIHTLLFFLQPGGNFNIVAVPEPGTFSLLGASLLGLGLAGRRRARR